MHEISTAVHTAYLDPMTGLGMLVRPEPDHDVPRLLGMARTVLLPDPDRPGQDMRAWVGESLFGADWDAMMRRRDELGWEPSEDEYGGVPVHAGTTPDGREVIGLYGREPDHRRADPGGDCCDVGRASPSRWTRPSGRAQ